MPFQFGGFGNFRDFSRRFTDDFSDDAPSENQPVFRRGFPLRKRTVVIGLVLLFVLVGLPALARFLASYWWYAAERLTPVFWTQVLPQWVLLGVFTIIACAVLAPSLLLARRRGRQFAENSGNELAPLFGFRTSLIVVWVAAILLSLRLSLPVMDQWPMVLQFLYGKPFGTTETIFGRDVGFYVFTLPFLSFLRGWLVNLLFVTIVASAAVYALALFAALKQGGVAAIPHPVKSHLLGLGALLTVLWAISFWLRRYDLLYSPRGVGFGASYTDMHVVVWAYWALALLALSVGVGLLAAIRANRSWKFVGIMLLSFVAASAVLQSIVPSLVEKYVVEPNEFQKEKPYIEYNIAATLAAYGLDKAQISPIEPTPAISQADVQSDAETLDNVRLWDYRALIRSYKQLQEIRSYYNFSGVDTDRYVINSRQRQVMLAVRELDPSGMQNPTWVNSHLEFTHGFGLVMNPAGQVAANGQPPLWIRDLPPVTSVPINVQRPEIYFGEETSDYAFVKTKVKEFDYPMGEANARSFYQGTGGVPINSLWRQLVFALAFNDSKILFSDVFDDDSRVMYQRNIIDRLNQAAPFLLYDSDPYPAIVDGRIIWIVDAYTVTDRYPYSEPTQLHMKDPRSSYRSLTLNYIRNSVKATVDAYDGTMNFYVVDEQDPLIATWSRIFPSLFKPASQMSDDLKPHLRYPKDLFSVQANVYATYHMQDPNTFYNKEDVWRTLTGTGGENSSVESDYERDWRTIPELTSGSGSLDSYYVTLKLEGEKNSEFMLMTPYTPVGRDNMIAWLAGRCDGDRYGDLLVYRFSKRTLIYGPNQVAALINQTPEISAQLSLWSQRGSDVIRGHLLVIPVGKSLLYVQPLYLKAETSEMPELKRIILSSGGRVAWDETFAGALEKLLAQTAGGALPPQPKTPEPQEKASGGQTAGGNAAELARQAQEAWLDGQAAMKAGDWASYGKSMNRLETILSGLLEATGAQLEEPEGAPAADSSK